MKISVSILTMVILFIPGVSIVVHAANADSTKSVEKLLQDGRQLFHESIEDEDQIEPATAVFTELKEHFPSMAGRADAYLGALDALRGKHATWPISKFNWVKKGLKKMDSGIAQSPEDIEALFIHGSTCHYLPFFFGRKDNSRETLGKIASLLPIQASEYDITLIMNVIDFLVEEATLPSTQVAEIMQIKNQFAEK